MRIRYYPFTIIRRRKRGTSWLTVANPPPFTWLSHRKVKHVFARQRPKLKPHKIAAAIAVAPAAPTFIPKPHKHKPRVLPPHRKHRQLAGSWLGQSTGWTPPKHRVPKRRALPPVRHPKRARAAPFIGFAQTIIGGNRSWNWNAQVGLLNLTLGTVSKAWNWNHQAALLNLTLGTVSKAWNWAANTIPGLPFTLGVVSKAWNWTHNPAILVSQNIKQIRWNILRPVLWGILRGEEERPRKGP